MYEEEPYYDNPEFRDLLRRYEAERETGMPLSLEPDELTDIAGYYETENDLPRARQVAEEAARLYPGDTDPLIYLARFALEYDDDPQEARRYTDQVDDKDDPEYQYAVAEILIVEKRERKADKYLTDCYDRTEDREGRVDFIYDVAQLFIDYQLPRYASRWLEMLPDKDDEEYLEMHGSVCVDLKDYAEGEKTYARLTAKQPFNADYWSRRASMQMLLEDPKGAIESSEYAIAIDPHHAQCLLIKGNALLSLGRPQEALPYLERYRQEMPDDTHAETFVGCALMQQEDFAAALTHYERALDLATAQGDIHTRAEILRDLAMVHAAMGEKDKAMERTREMSQLPGDNEAEAHVMQGYTHLLNDEVQEAMDKFVKALELSDNDPEVGISIGIAALETRYAGIAYRVFQIMEQIGVIDEVRGVWAYYAMACRETDKQRDYQRTLKRACQTCPREVGKLFARELPEDLAPGQYYEYLTRQ